MILALGSNSKGQIGGAETFSAEPQVPKYVRQFLEDTCLQLFVGAEVVFILTADGELHGLGSNRHGQLGTGVVADCLTLQKIHLLCQKNVTTMACGPTHTVCVTDEGIFAFGNNTSGQLGLGHLCVRVRVPQMVPSLPGKNVKSVVCGETYTIIVTKSGRCYGWGKNNTSQLGIEPTEEPMYSPVEIPIGNNAHIHSLCTGRAHTLALDDTGKMYGFGDNRFGQLGLPICAAVQAKVLDYCSQVCAIAVGDYHSCVCLESGHTVLSMGSNAHGQLGLGHVHSYVSCPARMRLGATRVQSVVCSSLNSYCISRSGIVFGAGDNSYGQLGLGCDIPFSAQPVQVYSRSHPFAVSAVGHSVYICDGFRVSPSSIPHLQSVFSTVRNDILSLRSTSIGYDAFVKTDTDEIPIHSAIVFAGCPRLLSRANLESISTKKVFVLCIHNQVMEILLQFIYGDEDCLQGLCITSDIDGGACFARLEVLTRVVYHANDLGLERLKALALHSVETSLSHDSVCSVLGLAAQLNIESVVSLCLLFVRDTYASVMRGDGALKCASCLARYPHILAEVLQLQLHPNCSLVSKVDEDATDENLVNPTKDVSLPLDLFESNLQSLFDLCHSDSKEILSDGCPVRDLAPDFWIQVHSSADAVSPAVQICVHGCILCARSGFFRALMGSCESMKESQIKRVKLNSDFAPSLMSLKALVQFFYTGEIKNLDPSDALHILGLVNGGASAGALVGEEEATMRASSLASQGFFQMEDHDVLVKTCLDTLHERVTHIRAPELLCTAYSTGNSQVIDFLSGYVAEHIAEIQAHDVENALSAHPILAVEVLCRLARRGQDQVQDQELNKNNNTTDDDPFRLTANESLPFPSQDFA